MQIPKQIAQPNTKKRFMHRPHLTQILHFSQEQTVAAPPTQPTSSTSFAAQLTPSFRKTKKQHKERFSVSESSSVWRRKRQKNTTSQKLHSQQRQSIIKKIQTKQRHCNCEEIPKTITAFIGTCSLRNTNENGRAIPTRMSQWNTN